MKEMFVGAFTMERFSKGCFKPQTEDEFASENFWEKKKGVLYASWTQYYKHAQDTECQHLLLADDAYHFCRALGLVWSPPTWI